MSSAAEEPRLLNQELKLRIISALVMAALVLLVTWIGGYTFSLLWAVLAFAVYYEFYRICQEVVPASKAIAGGIALLLVVGTYHTTGSGQAYVTAAITCVVLAVWELIEARKIWVSTGFLYAALPFFAMSDLRGEDFLGLIVILVLFGIVWGADILAYFAGRLIGGPKLAPSISPKKTWSGFVGGLVGAFVLASSVILISGYTITWPFFLLVLVLAVICQLGDLAESSLKRKFDVKDSGALIPGHGGVLDRIDGLIAAAVVLWLFLAIMFWLLTQKLPYGNLFETLFL